MYDFSHTEKSYFCARFGLGMGCVEEAGGDGAAGAPPRPGGDEEAGDARPAGAPPKPRAPIRYSPSVAPMISRWISLVPAKIVPTRPARTCFSMSYSSA